MRKIRIVPLLIIAMLALQQCLAQTEAELKALAEQASVVDATLAEKEALLQKTAILSTSPVLKEYELKEAELAYVESCDRLEGQVHDLKQAQEACDVTADCDMSCVRSCAYQDWLPWSQCFEKCGCQGKVQGQVHVSQHIPWSGFTNIWGGSSDIQGVGEAYQASRGMVFNFKGDGCSKNQECTCNCGGTITGECPDSKPCPDCPKCPAKEDCPSCIDCGPDCPWDELEYYNLIYSRTDLWRSIGIAAAQHIVKTHNLHVTKNQIFYEITKESFLTREAHFTIVATGTPISLFIQIQRVSGQDDVFTISYFHKEEKFTLFAVTNRLDDIDTHIGFLSTNEFELLVVYNVATFQKKTSYSGYGFNIDTINASQTLLSIIQVFIEDFKRIQVVDRALISAAQQAVESYHLASDHGVVSYWTVNILEIGTINSFMVTPYDKNNFGFYKYSVKVVRDATYARKYHVDIQHSGRMIAENTSSKILVKHSLDIIVAIDTTSPNSYYNVVYQQNVITYLTVSTVTYGGQYFSVTSYSIGFDNVDPSVVVIIERIIKKESTNVILHESNAAVAALVKWALNKPHTSVELHPLEQTDKYAKIEVVSLTEAEGPWKVTCRAISYEESDSLYFCRLQYPSTNSVTYYVYVDQIKGEQYHVSVLLDGTEVLVTYEAILEQVEGTTFMKIISLSIIQDDHVQKEIEELTNIIGPHLPSVPSKPIETGTSTISVKITQVSNGTEELSYPFEHYQHPVTQKLYRYFPMTNNIMFEDSLRKISIGGGMKYLTQLFSGSVRPQKLDGYELYTYPVTAEKWKIYPDGKVYTNIGNGLVTDGGFDALIMIITYRGDNHLTKMYTYTQYKVEGLETEFRVWNNDLVTVVPDNYHIVSQFGYPGLLELVQNILSLEQPAESTFAIAIDERTGDHYLVYPDGMVTTIQGAFVCYGGVEGLQQYLLTQTIEITITGKYPQYQVIEVSNGLTFRLYIGGEVTDDKDNFICRSGVECLKAWLDKEFPETVITVQKVWRPTYQWFQYDGEVYFLYPDGKITTDEGVYICSGGLDGFRLWLIKNASTHEIVDESYTIYTDANTGTKYYVYTTGIVKSENGDLICLRYGLECLKVYLRALQDEDMPAVTYIGKEPQEPFTMTFKQYLQKGTNHAIWERGPLRYFNTVTGEAIHGFYDNYINTLTFDKELTLNFPDAVFDVVSVEGKDDTYLIHNSGAIMEMDGTFITHGGAAGLTKYLTTMKLVTLVGKGSGETMTYTVSELNKVFKFNNIDFYFLDDAEEVFCRSSSKALAQKCFYAYLADKYYGQIITSRSQPKFDIYIDGQGIEYYVYSTGLVTDADGNLICSSGGAQCLFKYLQDLYSFTTDIKVIPKESVKTNVDFFYFSYVDEAGVEFRYYMDGGLRNMNTFQRVIGSEAVQNVQKLTKIGQGVQTVPLSYQYVLVEGYDDLSSTQPMFLFAEDNSIWYNDFQYFIGWGKEKELQKFLTVMKNIRVQTTGTNFFVSRLDTKFPIQSNPFRVLTPEMGEICRRNDITAIYYCLIGYLVENHFEKFITETVAVPDYTIYVFDGVEYWVHNDGEVTTTLGEHICFGGVQCLIDYINNKKKDLQNGGKLSIDFVEHVPVYTDGTNTFEFIGLSLIDAKGVKVTGFAEKIATGALKLTEFKQKTAKVDVTVAIDTLHDNTHYYILPDGRVYTTDLLQVCNNGMAGLYAWLQVYYNTQGDEDVPAKTIVFKHLDNLTFNIIDTLGFGIQDAKGNWVVYPRKDKAESQLLLHEALYILGHFPTTNNVWPIYTVYTDNAGFEYRVYDDYGLVITNDSLQRLICATGGLPCLLDYLRTNSLQVVPKDTYTVYQATNGNKYAITQTGEVWTYPGFETLICDSSEDPVQCLLDYLNGRVKEPIVVDYTVYTHNGIDYLIYKKDGKVVLRKDETVICQTGGFQCLLNHLLVVEPVEETEAFTVWQDVQTLEQYKVYASGTVIHKDTTLICATGGYQCLYDYLLEKQKIEEYEVIMLDDGRTFHHFPKTGKVVQMPEEVVVCETGGIPCLREWLASTQNEYVSYDPWVFEVRPDGSVFFYPSMEKLCDFGGHECIREWIEAQDYYTYLAGGFEFQIYGDGKGTFANGTVVCETGGEPCIDAFLESLKPKFTLYELDNRTFEVYPDGKVIETTDGKRETICVTGGIPCIHETLRPKFDVYKHDENNTFHIYENGKVTKDDGELICETGGKPCLDEWIANNLPRKVDRELEGTPLSFLVYGSGKVTDMEGNVICETGGEPCLDEWLKAQLPTPFEHKIGELHYVFQVYPDGRVRLEFRGDNEQICATGGVDCMNEWIKNNCPTIHTHEGIDYYVFPDGRVLDQDWNEVCKVGGMTCLEEYLLVITYEAVEVPIWDGEVLTFREFGNGKVDWAHEPHEVVCQTGGSACLTQWVIDNYPKNYTNLQFGQNVTYFEFLDGRATDADKKTLKETFGTVSVDCTTGGVGCLIQYLTAITFDTVQMLVGPFETDYFIYTNGNTSVFRASDWKMICESGGEACLQDVVNQNVPVEYEFQGIKYYVFPNGAVWDQDRNIICETGGEPCLEEYWATLGPQEYLVNIFGTDYTFVVNPAPGDSVVLKETGDIICETGGKPCLDEWLRVNVPEVYTHTTSTGQEFVFYIYADGKVIDAEENVICLDGGKPCLLEWLKVNGDLLGTYTQFIFKIDGQLQDYYYNVFDNGRVLSFPDNTVICETGGEACITAYVQQNLQLTHEEIPVPMPDGTTVVFKSYTNGVVIDGTSNVICEKDGATCLQAYIDKVYADAGLVLNQENVQASSNNTWYFLALCFLIASLGVTYYMKKDEKVEKVEGFEELRESLLSGDLKYAL